MDRNEGVVRWCPLPNHHDFLTINVSYRLIQMYRARQPFDAHSFSFEKASKHNEFPLLTCYDWSPVIHGLVAVGTQRGDVHLLRADDDSNESVVLPLKLGRAAQSVAFNTLGHLAVALDRVRNDQCLQIWDINQRLAKWDRSKKGWTNVSQSADPLLKLEASVSVTSCRFFEDQPQTLVAGIRHSSVRIHDLRDPHSLVLSFPTRCNNNLAIDYCNPNYFASSSLDRENSNLIIWDKRLGRRRTASALYQESVEHLDVPWGGVLKLNSAFETGDKTSYIKNLRYCRDQRGKLGMLSGVGELQVLDVVKEYIEPVVGADDNEYNPDLLHVKKSHVLESRSTDDSKSQIMSFDWMTVGPQSTPPKLIGLRADGSLELFQLPSERAHLHSQLVDFGAPARFSNLTVPTFADTRDEKDILGPLLPERPQAPQETKEKPQDAVTSSSGRRASQVPVTEPFDVSPDVLKSAFASITDGQSTNPGESVTNTTGSRNDKQSNILADTLAVVPKKPWSSRVRHEHTHWGALNGEDSKKRFTALRERPLNRVKAGYLFDCAKNADIVSEDEWLQDAWKWIAGAEESAAEQGMTIGNVDLSYLGVETIWMNNLGEKRSSRLLDGVTKPNATTWEQLIGQLNSRAGRGKWQGIKTAKPETRQFCLAIAGWEDSKANIDEILERMEARGQYTKAAAWALIDQSPERAVDILKRAQKLFIAMALEIQHKSRTSLDESGWEDSFRDQPDMAEDPYLRALYAYIRTGDWAAIADERCLPLKDRVAVALQHLPDEQLTYWLEREMEEAITHGDIEGIILSGITDNLLDILERYIAKFGDLQTAVLIMSFCCPRYISDYRFDHWRQEYRTYLNNNRLFIERCKYDTRSIKLSRQRDGTTILKPPPRQVTIRCLHCASELSNDARRSRTASNATAVAVGSGPIPPLAPSMPGALPARNPLMGGPGSLAPTTGAGAGGAAGSGSGTSAQHQGIACSKCGRHLPRCAICMRHLGMARSGRAELNTEPQKRLANFFSFCLRCRHAFHADHAAAWFARHLECPHPECRCECRRDAGLLA